MQRMYSTQALSMDEVFEISYLIDHCLLYKQAEKYLGHKPYPIDSQAAIQVYFQNVYFDDCFEPFDSFLRWTQIGTYIDAVDDDHNSKIFNVEIPIIKRLFELAEQLGSERQSELEAFSKEFSKNVCDFEINFNLENGIVKIDVGFMQRLNWHEIVPKFLKYIELAKEMCARFQKELDSL